MTYEELYYLPGTTVLRNRFGISDPGQLRQVEHLLTSINLSILPPMGISLAGYRQINAHLYGDLYDWAGQFRSAPLTETGTAAVYGEELENQLSMLFDGLAPVAGEGIAYDRIDYAMPATDVAYLAAGTAYTLVKFRPFPAGNDLTMSTFLTQLTSHVGYRLDFNSWSQTEWRYAMHELDRGDPEPMAEIALAHRQKLDHTELTRTVLDWAEAQLTTESIDEVVDRAELSLGRAATPEQRDKLNWTIGRLQHERELAAQLALNYEETLYHDACARGTLTWHAQRSAAPGEPHPPDRPGLAALGAVRQLHDAWATAPAEPFRANVANREIDVAKEAHRHWANTHLLRGIDHAPPPQRTAP